MSDDHRKIIIPHRNYWTPFPSPWKPAQDKQLLWSTIAKPPITQPWSPSSNHQIWLRSISARLYLCLRMDWIHLTLPNLVYSLIALSKLLKVHTDYSGSPIWALTYLCIYHNTGDLSCTHRGYTAQWRLLQFVQHSGCWHVRYDTCNP